MHGYYVTYCIIFVHVSKEYAGNAARGGHDRAKWTRCGHVFVPRPSPPLVLEIIEETPRWT